MSLQHFTKKNEKKRLLNVSVTFYQTLSEKVSQNGPEKTPYTIL